LQQPKRVTRKGRHYSYAPVKNTGVPIESVQPSCCEKNSQETLRQFSQKTHDNCTTSMACLGWKKIKRRNRVAVDVCSLKMIANGQKRTFTKKAIE